MVLGALGKRGVFWFDGGLGPLPPVPVWGLVGKVSDYVVGTRAREI